jgi:enoyl-CoA hydratase/carnithine racemase
MNSLLLTQVRGAAAWLTLNRAEKRNALSWDLLRELDRAIAQLAADSSIRAVVIAANGPVFCAGHDLAEMVGSDEKAYRELFTLCSGIMLRLRKLPQPVIARVHNMATAAGCQLVAACDLAVAAESATFATPGVKIGLFCTTPMVPLVRAIPAKLALEMLLTGKSITAMRAYEIGLVSRVVPSADLDSAVQEYIDGIASSSPQVIRLGKAAFYDQLALDERTAYDDANRVMVGNALCADAQEGMQAFLAKRKPVWTGE